MEANPLKPLKVSIIIPAYNEEKYISETLKTALAQDYADFEIILVDNASTDKTIEIAKTVSEKVRIVSEPRKGTMWACARGQQEANGEILVRMDADCRPDPSWLSRGVKHFKNNKVVGVSGPYDYYDAGIFFRVISLFVQKYIYHFANYTVQLPFIKLGALTIGGNSFMRASAIKASGGFNTILTFYGDDTDTAMRLAKHGYVVFDPQLTMKTSARRFKQEGVFTIEYRYLLHFFKTILKK